MLRPGGVLNLPVPDRRSTFDIRRCLTGARDVIGAAMEGRRRPDSGIVFDHFSAHQDIDVAALRRGEPVPETPWLYPLGMGEATQDPAERRGAQLQILHPRRSDPLAAHLASIAPAPTGPVSPGATEMLAISPREQSLIEGKRALLGVVRRDAATARARLRF